MGARRREVLSQSDQVYFFTARLNPHLCVVGLDLLANPQRSYALIPFRIPGMIWTVDSHEDRTRTPGIGLDGHDVVARRLPAVSAG